jgi:hypothetical protein
MTALTPELGDTDTDGNGITHVVCCNEDIALCGTDVSGQPFVGGDFPVDCVVCLDTDACPGCGLAIVILEGDI